RVRSLQSGDVRLGLLVSALRERVGQDELLDRSHGLPRPEAPVAEHQITPSEDEAVLSERLLLPLRGQAGLGGRRRALRRCARDSPAFYRSPIHLAGDRRLVLPARAGEAPRLGDIEGDFVPEA